MSHVSYTELRGNLAQYMDQVCDDHAPVFVTRQKGRPVVLMSEAEYASIMETFHLLRSPRNAERLLESIAELEASGGVEHELAEPVAKPVR